MWLSAVGLLLDILGAILLLLPDLPHSRFKIYLKSVISPIVFWRYPVLLEEEEILESVGKIFSPHDDVFLPLSKEEAFGIFSLIEELGQVHVDVEAKEYVGTVFKDEEFFIILSNELENADVIMDESYYLKPSGRVTIAVGTPAKLSTGRFLDDDDSHETSVYTEFSIATQYRGPADHQLHSILTDAKKRIYARWGAAILILGFTLQLLDQFV